jgi:hypothetical protein
MLAWIRTHEVLLGWLSAASVLVFVGSLIAVPWLIVRIPADYFVARRRGGDDRPARSRWRWTLLILKNVFGVVLILAGVAMLVLPGQGILAILVGLMCLDVPGKYGLELRLVRQRPVIGSINWVRRKAGRAPLQVPR